MSKDKDTFIVITAELQSAMGKKKCHRCDCFQSSVKAFKSSVILNHGLADLLNEAEKLFENVRYDCLGCEICWPANAQNLAAVLDPDLPEGDLCPTEIPEQQQVSWPPYLGDY